MKETHEERRIRYGMSKEEYKTFCWEMIKRAKRKKIERWQREKEAYTQRTQVMLQDATEEFTLLFRQARFLPQPERKTMVDESIPFRILAVKRDVTMDKDGISQIYHESYVLIVQLMNDEVGYWYVTKHPKREKILRKAMKHSLPGEYILVQQYGNLITIEPYKK